MSQAAEPVQPPEPPDVPRHIHLSASRGMGLGAMALIPVLALFHVFGERWERAERTTPAFDVRVEYPTSFRYKMLNAITVQVHNRSGRQLDTVTVALDTGYVSRFSTVIFTPSVDRAYEVPLTRMAAGETRLVSIELQAERYGRHAGDLTVSAGADTAAVRIHTLVWP